MATLVRSERRVSQASQAKLDDKVSRQHIITEPHGHIYLNFSLQVYQVCQDPKAMLVTLDVLA
jgi:hypothetical protein